MRRGKLMQVLGIGGVVVLAVVVTVGCAARTRYLTVRPPQVTSWEGQPLPVTAALVVSEAVRAATDQEQVNCPFSTTNFVFQTGTAFGPDADVTELAGCGVPVHGSVEPARAEAHLA